MMIFIGGITQKTKELLYQAAAMVCGRCGRYGRYQVYMTYMCLSLFFIPVFKWNRRYYAKTTCCGTLYALAEDVGRRIERGEELEIRPEDLTLLEDGHKLPAWETRERRCPACGFSTREDYEYCPKCGQRLL